MLEAGVLFGIAIDAIRDIKVHSRQGGQRSALISIVFSVIALESFVNEMTEQAQNMSPSQPAEVSTFDRTNSSPMARRRWRKFTADC
jgi:hypothetical protein